MDEASESNKEEIERKYSTLKEASLGTEFEKQARKTAETTEVVLENSNSHLKILLEKERNKNDELRKQRDQAPYHKEEFCR